jgi:hypothetical protein
VLNDATFTAAHSWLLCRPRDDRHLPSTYQGIIHARELGNHKRHWHLAHFSSFAIVPAWNWLLVERPKRDVAACMPKAALLQYNELQVLAVAALERNLTNATYLSRSMSAQLNDTSTGKKPNCDWLFVRACTAEKGSHLKSVQLQHTHDGCLCWPDLLRQCP